MYYAILDTRSDVTSSTYFLWGEEPKDLAKKVLEECKKSLDDDYEGMTLDEIEEEYEDAYFDEYRLLKKKRKITTATLCGFVFSIGDLSIEVAAACDGYSALVLAFDEYAVDKPSLSMWKMASSCDETEESLASMNDELLALCESYIENDGLQYFSRR